MIFKSLRITNIFMLTAKVLHIPLQAAEMPHQPAMQYERESE